MPKFRKKPVVIEAVQFTTNRVSLEEAPKWFTEALRKTWHDTGYVERVHDRLHIRTLVGMMVANPGDWIIRGVKGDLYPCKAEIFAATYEPVE